MLYVLAFLAGAASTGLVALYPARSVRRFKGHQVSIQTTDSRSLRGVLERCNRDHYTLSDFSEITEGEDVAAPGLYVVPRGNVSGVQVVQA